MKTLLKAFSKAILGIILIAVLSVILLNTQSLSVQAQTTPSDPQSSDKAFNSSDATRAKDFTNSSEKIRLAPVTSIGSSAIITPTKVTYKVKPILFIPSDKTADSGNAQAIDNTMYLLKRWYSGSLQKDNSAFIFTPETTVVYKASHPISYYKCPNHETSCDTYDGIWNNVQTELTSAGFPLWSDGTSYIIFVKGGAGWSGSSCLPNCSANWPYPGPVTTAGISILGDWALDGISGKTNTECFAQIGSACYQNPQRGAVGHEMGHTFGLAHANDTTGSIMYDWWNYPNVSLISVPGNDEKALLRGSSFFTSTACSYNSDLVQQSMPSSIKGGTLFTSTFTITNTGYCSFPAIRTDLHVVRDDVWRTTSVVLKQSVPPTLSYTFIVPERSPNYSVAHLPVVKDNIWRIRVDSNYIGHNVGGPITITK